MAATAQADILSLVLADGSGAPLAAGAPSGGQAANELDEPLEVCRGTFRYLVGPKTQSGLVIVVR